MHVRIAPLSVLSVFVIVLAGCAAAPAADEVTETTSAPPSATSSNSIDTDPATGETFSGSGYSFTAPEGWAEAAPPAGGAFDLFVASADASDGFADNVNVLIQDGVVTPDIVESDGTKQLSEIWKTDVEVGERVEVAGEEVAHLAADMDLNGITYVVDQYYLGDGDKSFIVTFSSDADADPSEREQVAESVLATWTWE